MPRRMYEYLFLFDSGKTSGDVMAAVNTLHATFEKYGAEILASRPWDERRLAYPIKRGGVSHKKGLYYLTYFRAEGKDLVPLTHDLSLNEMVLRNLILRTEPKLVDVMLQLAQDEHAVALQTATDTGEDEGGEDSGPRRGRRGGPGGHGGHGGHERPPERAEE